MPPLDRYSRSIGGLAFVALSLPFHFACRFLTPYNWLFRLCGPGLTVSAYLQSATTGG